MRAIRPDRGRGGPGTRARCVLVGSRRRRHAPEGPQGGGEEHGGGGPGREPLPLPPLLIVLERAARAAPAGAPAGVSERLERSGEKGATQTRKADGPESLDWDGWGEQRSRRPLEFRVGTTAASSHASAAKMRSQRPAAGTGEPKGGARPRLGGSAGLSADGTRRRWSVILSSTAHLRVKKASSLRSGWVEHPLERAPSAERLSTKTRTVRPSRRWGHCAKQRGTATISRAWI